ncbi:MAG TPA: hypothetical protein VN636_18285 [Acidimicrobiia bacterium]|nr:hypothetical protein [Acidimicrobiia bacterium]
MTEIRSRRRTAAGLALALLLASCSSSARSTSGTTIPAGTPGASVPATVPGRPVDACTLLTAQDASRLTRVAMVRQPPDTSGPGLCQYAASTNAATTVQIEGKVDPDGATAQAEYPTWMQAIVSGPGFTVTPVSGFADGATIVHSAGFDAIAFRRGPVLVKIGVDPATSPAALRFAAATALARLESSGSVMGSG